MNRGVIVSMDFDKGLAYLLDEKGQEYVLLTTGLENILRKDLAVTFRLRITRTGPIAIDVHPQPSADAKYSWQ